MPSPNFRKWAGLPVGKKDCKESKVDRRNNQWSSPKYVKTAYRQYKDFLSFYGENEEMQSERIGKLMETSS